MTKVTLILATICLLFNIIRCEIRFAFTFWRHGARAPDRGLNGNNIDIIGEQWESPGELTASGMRMHYLLGKENKYRWDGFLSTSYDNKEIYVKSTDYRRTIMSALSHLQGLYPSGTGPTLTVGQIAKALPPVTSELFASETNSLGGNALPDATQVVPVHLFDKNGPYFFYYDPYACQPIKEMFEKNTKLKQNVDILESIDFNWGSKLKLALNLNDDSFLLNFGNMYLIADSYVAAYIDNRPLTKFIDAGINLEQFFRVAHEFEFNNIFYLYNGDQDKWFARIVMTPFFEDVFRWMDTRIAFDIAGFEYTGFVAPKVVLYSAHDVTLGAAQTILAEAFADQIKVLYETPYASSFIWELYRPDDIDISTLSADNYTIKISYNKEEYLTLQYLQFKKTLLKYILSSKLLNEFCGWNNDQSEMVPRSYITATIILSILLFVSVLGLIILFIIYKKTQNSSVALNKEQIVSVL